jgi:hypothetical protein
VNTVDNSNLEVAGHADTGTCGMNRAEILTDGTLRFLRYVSNGRCLDESAA